MLKHVRVGELEIEYDEVGEEAGSGGRTFVLVHGFTGSRDDFADVLESIGASGRTLAPDLRGHGGTTNPGRNYSLSQLSADLAGFLDAVGISNCDLLGHSLGGMIALHFVLAHPERVDSLILMDTSDRSHGDMARWLHRAIKFATRRIPMRWHWRVIRANRRKLPGPMQRAAREMGTERFWARLRTKLEAMDPVAFDQLLGEIMKRESVTKRLDEIHCPTLVMVGEEDTPFLEPSRRMAEHIPDAELVVFKNAHHSPQIETPKEWLIAIQGHLERARTQSTLR
jgi:pimeloyl-ACP methyl ester carboxylesterase